MQVTMNALVSLDPPRNPAEVVAYPPTLPIELVLRTAPLSRILEAYGIMPHEWEQMRLLPQLHADLRAAKEMLEREGMSFRVKARLQSEELLKTSWRMIHASNDEVPATVRADLLKFTIRAAGLVEDKQQGASGANNFQININLG